MNWFVFFIVTLLISIIGTVRTKKPHKALRWVFFVLISICALLILIAVDYEYR